MWNLTESLGRWLPVIKSMLGARGIRKRTLTKEFKAPGRLEV